MNSRAAIFVVALLAQTLTVSANPAAPTYDEAGLIRVQQGYAPGILGNFRDVILPLLDPADAAALADVKFEFPLQYDEAEPFAYFATGRTVVMSAASIRFLDDLTTAAAWLHSNGYAQNSLTDYVSMLKYGVLGDRPPMPLAALCVPANALDDPKVKSIADNGFNTAVVFIMLHELGHILYQHPGYRGVDPAVARANEEEADHFALAGLRRLNASPRAMIPFFTLMAFAAKNRGDFEDEATFNAYLSERTHPLDAHRIARLAESLKQESGMAELADQISQQIVGGLQRQGVQQLMTAIGRTALEVNLAPRRHNEKLGTPCDMINDGQDFSGPYDGEMTTYGSEVDVSMILRRRGSSVSGFLSFGVATFTIQGQTDSGTLHYRWFADENSGNGILQLNEGGVLSGTWGNGSSALDGGTLTLHRRLIH